jgi:ATP-dependent DNA helicase RecQ|tara:strand:- start:669 stop:1292 length:624 start_codon:yes stop_codon:yes gene_type:complete
MRIQTNELINNYEKSIMLMVLSCVQELEIKVGKKKLVSILQGSESNYIFENEFNNNPYYGLLQNYNSNQISKIIEKLFNMDLVRSEDLEIDYYSKVIDVTNKGSQAVNTKSLDNPQLMRELFEEKATQLTARSKILFEKLKNLRKEISKSINKPAFIICTDKVLREVAKQEPGDVDSLLSIKGIGNHFIEEYSSLFLNEIELNTSIV